MSKNIKKERRTFQRQELTALFIDQWFQEGISLWIIFKILANCQSMFSEEERRIRTDFLKNLCYEDLEDEYLENVASLGLYKAKQDYDSRLPIDFAEFAKRYMESDIAVYVSRVF